jgi:predicted DNA-binding transcriptional regulator YafY
LGTLHSAIFYKKVLKITYQPYENEAAFDLTFHPYFLKQYNNRWFVFGYNPDKERLDWNLAIDRIVRIEEVKGKYHKNTQIDWKEYFGDIIGVTKPENAELQNITLHFFGKTGKYMESKPLHGSQKSKWIDENTLEVKLSLLVNYELERLILSYADSVKVIQPKNLKAILVNRLKNAVAFY